MSLSSSASSMRFIKSSSAPASRHVSRHHSARCLMQVFAPEIDWHVPRRHRAHAGQSAEATADCGEGTLAAPISRLPAEDEYVRSDYWDKPAFETIRPRRLTAPLVFNSAHSGRDYPERFLRMTRLDHLSIRQSEDAYVDELFAPRAASRHAAPPRPLPARLSRRQPRALGARPPDVRRAAQRALQHDEPAGRRRPRHARPRRRREQADLPRAADASRTRACASRASTSPITRRCSGS